MNRKIATAIVVTTLLVGTGLASAQLFGRRGGAGAVRGVGSGTVEISIYAADPTTGVDPIETLTPHPTAVAERYHRQLRGCGLRGGDRRELLAHLGSERI